MGGSMRVDGDGVADLTGRMRETATAWAGPRGGTSIHGVGSGVQDAASAAVEHWASELEAASTGLGELADAVDTAVRELASADATLARGAHGRGPRAV